ncbi:hypothetical protein GCM10010207_87200 [Streptomyces atratus]|uniref:FAD-binding protein n=1 Tax=Streptomyces atratus TaxID=1893 RepID=UPI0019B4D956|nr:hypothetical protein GCM10010207_87200 [Streptomyces atratus]
MIKTTNDKNSRAERGDKVEVHDVVVAGTGAAGFNAALLLGRALRKVVVIDAGEPRNAPAAHMHGFLSRDGLPPATLLDLGRAELARYGVQFLRGRVETVLLSARRHTISPACSRRRERILRERDGTPQPWTPPIA